MVWLPTAEQLYITAWECTMGSVQTNEEWFHFSTVVPGAIVLLPLSISHAWSPGPGWPCARQVNSRKKSIGRCLHGFPWHSSASTLLATCWLHSRNNIWAEKTGNTEGGGAVSSFIKDFARVFFLWSIYLIHKDELYLLEQHYWIWQLFGSFWL